MRAGSSLTTFHAVIYLPRMQNAKIPLLTAIHDSVGKGPHAGTVLDTGGPHCLTINIYSSTVNEMINNFHVIFHNYEFG